MECLDKEHQQYIITRLPKDVIGVLKEYAGNVFLAGGFIRACITGEKPHDIDLFVSSKELADKLAYQLKGGDRLIKTEFAYTICRRLSVQIIHRWLYTDVEQLILSFDFAMVRAAIYFNPNTSDFLGICGGGFYQDLAAKKLTYCSPVREEEPGGSLIRVLKYYQRGYRIDLKSLGLIVARLLKGIDVNKMPNYTEADLGKVILGLLFDVDPAADLDSVYNERIADND